MLHREKMDEIASKPQYTENDRGGKLRDQIVCNDPVYIEPVLADIQGMMKQLQLVSGDDDQQQDCPESNGKCKEMRQYFFCHGSSLLHCNSYYTMTCSAVSSGILCKIDRKLCKIDKKYGEQQKN